MGNLQSIAPSSGETGAFGRYELLGKLAVGGMAEIFLAREELPDGSGRNVAIKKILPHFATDPDLIRLFRREASLAMNLSHPNIGRVYEFGLADRRYYIAMEWVEGVSLEHVVRRGQRFGGIPVPVAVRIIAEVAGALDHAHHAVTETGTPLELVHRDVSPANVMVSFQGVVKLMDFGIAKVRDVRMNTEVGAVRGKLAYLSPEQCLGEAIDARSDIFSLGVCLFEALCGKHLYRRRSQYESMHAIIEEPVPSIRRVRPELPPALDEIVQRALQKNPDDRFAEASDFQHALEQWLVNQQEVVNEARVRDVVASFFLEEQETAATGNARGLRRRRRSESLPDLTPPTYSVLPSDSVRPSPRTHPLWIVAAVVTVGLAVATAWWVLEPSRSAGPPPPTEPAPGPTETTPEASRESPAVAAETGEVEPTEAVDLEAPIADVEEVVESDLEAVSGEPERPSVEPPIAQEASAREMAARQETLRSSSTPVDTQAATRSETTVGAPGRLSINTRPWSRVLVNGQQAGTTPVGRIEVPAGIVQLTLIDRDGNEHQRTVRVASDQHARVFYDLAPSPTPTTEDEPEVLPPNPF